MHALSSLNFLGKWSFHIQFKSLEITLYIEIKFRNMLNKLKVVDHIVHWAKVPRLFVSFALK